MPSGKAVSMGVVLTNGTNFISLYFRSEKNDNNNEVVDKFYWVQSNASGVPTNSRNNALNGYFSSQSSAIADTPDGYGGLPPTDDWKSKYRVAYLNMFPFDEQNLMGYPTAADRTKSEYAEMAQIGMNDAVLTIDWDSIFTTYAEQTANNSSSWTKYDDLINYFKSLTTTDGRPMGVSLRIRVAKDDSTHYDLENPANTNGWYGLSNSAKDQLGFPARIGRGLGHVSFAYPTGVSQVLDFVSKTVTRYKAILGNQLNWCSVAYSAQHEDGYNYENQHYVSGSESPVPAYPAIYDYSIHSTNGAKAWLASSEKYNGSISALNAVWGTSFASFDAITMPGAGMTGSHELLNTIYTTNAGKDWYEWNMKIINAFLINCEAIVEEQGVRFTTETGSDVDVLSPRRHTIDISRFVSIGSMHKTQLGAITRDPKFAMSVDMLRENYAEKGGYLGTEINTNDFVEFYGITDHAVMESIMKEMITSCILDAKAKYIMFISRKESGFFNIVKNVAIFTKSLMANPSFRVPAVIPSFEYSINQILNNGIDWLRNQWIGAGGSVTTRVKAIQSITNTAPPPSTNCVFPYQIYPIQNFCLSSGSIRASTYNHIFESVKSTHWLALVPTHSNSYIEGQLSLCDYTITGVNDEVIYVKNTQQVGHQVTYSSIQDNNHPRYYPENPVYFNDAVFVLPLNQSYRIDFTCKSSHAISATVETLDINPAHDSTLDYRRKLSTAGTPTGSFTFNPATAGTNFIRQIKFNCNRLNSTDTDANI